MTARDEAGMPSRWLTDRQAKSATNLDAIAALRLRDGFAVDPYRGLRRAGGCGVAPRGDGLREIAGPEGQALAGNRSKSRPPTPSCARRP